MRPVTLDTNQFILFFIYEDGSETPVFGKLVCFFLKDRDNSSLKDSIYDIPITLPGPPWGSLGDFPPPHACTQ